SASSSYTTRSTIEGSGTALDGGGGAGAILIRVPAATLADGRTRLSSTRTRPCSIHRCTVARETLSPPRANSVTTSLSSRSRLSASATVNESASIIGVGFVFFLAASELRVRGDVRLQIVEPLPFAEPREPRLIGDVEIERRVSNEHAHVGVFVLEAQDRKLS